MSSALHIPEGLLHLVQGLDSQYFYPREEERVWFDRPHTLSLSTWQQHPWVRMCPDINGVRSEGSVGMGQWAFQTSGQVSAAVSEELCE